MTDKLAEVEQLIEQLGEESDCDVKAAKAVLLPIISRLLDRAHADALRAALSELEASCDIPAPAECCKTEQMEEGFHDGVCNLFNEAAKRINALAPKRAHLERELEMARAVQLDLGDKKP